MNNSKIVTVTLLGSLAGLVMGFALMGLMGRQAAAQPVSRPGGDPIDLQLAQGNVDATLVNAQGSTVGVGGSFVTDVYDKVSPSVVHVTNRFQVSNPFFGSKTNETSGSGVIVDPSGFILTNYHVISQAQELSVLLNDGTQYPATIIGQDPGTDLALLKVEAPTALPAAELGDSTMLKVGEWVVAIGNPRGLDWTVTVGVISAIGREISAATGQTMRGLIQTDAAINPGNSGGPLLSSDGKVIGINNAIISGSGGSEGIGLAIPINTAKEILDDLKTYGKVVRPWLGTIIYDDVSAPLARRLNLPVDYGVIIDEVFKDSPAFKGGILPDIRDNSGGFQYDILTQVDGTKITSERQLLDMIREHKPGDTIKFTGYRILNGGPKAMELSVVLEALPDKAEFRMGFI